MWIKNQRGYELVNMDKIAVLYVGTQGNDIMMMHDGKHLELGHYQTREDVFDVLNMIYYAIDNGEYAFEMPSEEEMRRNIQHKAHMTSTKHNHGRS